MYSYWIRAEYEKDPVHRMYSYQYERVQGLTSALETAIRVVQYGEPYPVRGTGTQYELPYDGFVFVRRFRITVIAVSKYYQ